LLVWEGTEKTSIKWIQKDNPLSATDKNMEPMNVKLFPSGVPYKFIGLSKSVTNAQTLLAGSEDRLWFSVGFSGSGNRQPAYREITEGKVTVHSATKQELYVFIPISGIAQSLPPSRYAIALIYA